MVKCFFKYLKTVKSECRSRLNERNIEFVLRVKVEGPELKEFAEKICANADTLLWDSKEHTSQQKRKNYNNCKVKQKRKRFTNTYIDEFLGNISSTDNDSDDSDGERSGNNIDMFIDQICVFFLKDVLFSHVFIAHTK